jgi:hypothetical protein
MQSAVNAAVFDRKRMMDRPQSGLSGEQFTVFDTLNSSAHASLAMMVTTIEFAKKPEFRRPIIEKHIEYWKSLCNNLNTIEQLFRAGKSKADVLIAFKKTLVAHPSTSHD